jgi:hypothetical protein
MSSSNPSGNKRAVIFCLALVTGGFAGWLLTPTPHAAPPAISTSKAQVIPSVPFASDPAKAASVPEENTFVARLHGMLSAGTPKKRERAILRIADDLSVSEIQDALQRLETIQIRERERVRSRLLARWSILDPEGAISYAMARENLADRTAAVEAALSGWLEKDPAAAEAWITALPTGAVKIEAMTALVRALAVSNPKHALELAQNPQNLSFKMALISRDGGTPLIHTLLDKWLDDDPAAAAAAVLNLPQSVHFRRGSLHVAGKRWAGTDLDAALAWAQANTPKMDTSEYQQNPLTGVLDGWIAKDPKAAIEWINNYPDGDEKVGLIRSLVSHIDDTNPVEATALAGVMPPGTMREEAIVSAARSWLETDPAAAATWALRQEDEDVRRISLRSVAAEWMRHDPAGVRDWINSLPADATTDTMLRDAVEMVVNGVSWGGRSYMGFIDSMSGEAIQNVADLTARISDEAERMKAYTTLAGKWLQRDAPAARAWVENLPISDAEKLALLQAKPKPWPPRPS